MSTSSCRRSDAMRDERGGVPILRIALVDVDERRDVGGHRGGQAARDELVMPLHEHIGDDGLQQDDRRDDDDERARIKALRQEAAEPAHRHGRAAHSAGSRRSSSVDHEAVADAAHGLQEDRVGRIDLDLAAQAVDLHVDRAFVGGNAVAGERLARDVVAGVAVPRIVRISRSRSVMRTISSPRRNSPRSKR